MSGKPETRYKDLVVSSGGTWFSVVWDCTAGQFKWFYNFDETLVVLEGEAFISAEGLAERRIAPGDVVFFPAGCSATWRVTNYIRKVAFLRYPIYPPMGFFVRAWSALLRRIIRRRQGGFGA